MEKKGKQEEKHKTHIATEDFYNFYAEAYFKQKEESKKTIIKKNSKYYLTKKQYSKILDSFNTEVRNLMVYDNFEYRLPARLGYLLVTKKKITPYIGKDGEYKNPLPVNWKDTLDLWKEDAKARESKKLIRYDNKHFNGHLAKWTHSKKTAIFTWKSAYAFVACRTAKTMLGAAILDKNINVDYYLRK